MNSNSISVEDLRADKLRADRALAMLPVNYSDQVSITKDDVVRAMAQLKSLVAQQKITERDLVLALEVLCLRTTTNPATFAQPVVQFDKQHSYSIGKQRMAPSSVPMAVGWVTADVPSVNDDTAERTSNIMMENHN
ncbi:hypothetical protein KCU65_g7924, partial [Aureobasidium melanogenum]